MKTLYVECTHTYDTDLNTGIQRVVRNLLRFLPEAAAPYGVEVVPVVLHEGRLLRAGDLPSPAHEDAPGAAWRVKHYLKNLYRALRTLLVALFPFAAFERFLFAPREVFGLNYLIERTLLLPLRLKRPPVPLPETSAPASEEGSLLLLLDSSWHLPIWGAVDEMRSRGIRVFAVTYDLIPITHPRFCDETLVRLFNGWFTQSLRRVEGYIAISRTVRDDLVGYVRGLGDAPLSPRFGYFLLGADVKTASAGEEPVRLPLREWFAAGSVPYLIVCTIEPRKNHAYLLDAFDRLWQRGFDVRLMIVGRIGWKVDDLVARIRSHREYGSRLTMWNDLDDSELSYAYAHAKMLLFPSFVEGYGLPIVESLHCGLPVMASDIPVHREVGEDRIGYFDLASPSDLVEKIAGIEASGAVGRVDGSQARIADWRDSARTLMDEIVRLERTDV